MRVVTVQLLVPTLKNMKHELKCCCFIMFLYILSSSFVLQGRPRKWRHFVSLLVTLYILNRSTQNVAEVISFSTWITTYVQDRIMVPPDSEAWKRLRAPRKNICNLDLILVLFLDMLLTETAIFLSRNFGTQSGGKFLLSPAVRAHIGTGALRLQPHQPHGWSGSVYVNQFWEIKWHMLLLMHIIIHFLRK